MDFSNLFSSLYDIAITLIKTMGSVWVWLTEPLDLAIPYLSDIPIIGGWLFSWSIDYSPIELLGVGLALLLVLWVIKHLIPLG